MTVFLITVAVFAYWIVGLLVMGSLHRWYLPIHNRGHSHNWQPIDPEDFADLGGLAAQALVWPLFLLFVFIVGVGIGIMKIAGWVIKHTLERR